MPVTATMQTLAAWLLEQIAADEAVARAASPSPWQYGDVDSVAGGMLYDASRSIAGVFYEQPGDHDGSIVRHLLSDEADANGQHIARHDPAHVLAVCEAHRRIVEAYREAASSDAINWDNIACGEWNAYEQSMKWLAAIYADRDGFREEWR